MATPTQSNNTNYSTSSHLHIHTHTHTVQPVQVAESCQEVKTDSPNYDAASIHIIMLLVQLFCINNEIIKKAV